MRTFALIALAALLSLNAAELPFKPEFACDMVMTGGKQAGKGRMVMAKQGVRMEIASDQGKMVMIMKKGQNVVNMLMVDMKMVMSVPMQPGMYQDPTADPNATWKKTGSETVNGVACDRYEWKGSKGEGTMWIDPAKSVIIRSKDAKGEGQVDYANHVVGAQKDSEFAVPADYKPFNAAAFGGQ